MERSNYYVKDCNLQQPAICYESVAVVIEKPSKIIPIQHKHIFGTHNFKIEFLFFYFEYAYYTRGVAIKYFLQVHWMQVQVQVQVLKNFRVRVQVRVLYHN